MNQQENLRDINKEEKEMWGGCSMCAWTSSAMVPAILYSPLYATKSTQKIDLKVSTAINFLKDGFDSHNTVVHQGTANFMFLRDQTARSQ